MLKRRERERDSDMRQLSRGQQRRQTYEASWRCGVAEAVPEHTRREQVAPHGGETVGTLGVVAGIVPIGTDTAVKEQLLVARQTGPVSGA